LAKLTARLAAANILTEVTVRQRSLNSVLATTLPDLDERERGFCQQLCYGVLRWYPSLQFLASQLLSKSLKNKDADIYNLLLIGLYQLRDLRTPAHAAISETVNTAKQLGKKMGLRPVKRLSAQLSASATSAGNKTRSQCQRTLGASGMVTGAISGRLARAGHAHLSRQ
jgi:transcription termination factor NusB